MVRRWVAAWALASLGLVGCVDNDFRLTPKDSAAYKTVDVPKNLPQASLEAATRVDALGRQVLAANRGMGIDPVFQTVGVPELALFHRGSTQLFISEGLVQKCKTDAELAAVLCIELGKMASEAQTFGANQPASEPPYAPPVGSDSMGGREPDMTRQAERALWQKQNPRSNNRPYAAPQDPGELSREYVSKAGYNPDELLRVGPLVRQAESNSAIEKALGGQARR